MNIYKIKKLHIDPLFDFNEFSLRHRKSFIDLITCNYKTENGEEILAELRLFLYNDCTPTKYIYSPVTIDKVLTIL